MALSIKNSHWACDITVLATFQKQLLYTYSGQKKNPEDAGHDGTYHKKLNFSMNAVYISYRWTKSQM
jgi:hypothetical protein